jgi:hypothetical protein
MAHRHRWQAGRRRWVFHERYRAKPLLAGGWEVRDYGQKPSANYSIHPTQASAEELAARLNERERNEQA